MDVGAPAVVAAIHDATGVWIHDLPATPERIIAALTGGPDAASRRASRSRSRHPDARDRGPAAPAATRSRCARPPPEGES